MSMIARLKEWRDADPADSIAMSRDQITWLLSEIDAYSQNMRVTPKLDQQVDLRQRFEVGRCKDNHGCNAATLCMCGLVEDALDEIERLRAVLQTIASELVTILRSMERME